MFIPRTFIVFPPPTMLHPFHTLDEQRRDNEASARSSAIPQCRLVRSRYLHGKPALEATWSDIQLAQISFSQPGSGTVRNVIFWFWSLDSCYEKGLGMCRCHSTESFQLGLPKLPKVWLSDFHLLAMSSGWRFFWCFLVLKTHVLATWKTRLPIAAHWCYVSKQAYPLPVSSGTWHHTFDYRFTNFILDMLQEVKYICAPWCPAISCGLGHHLHLPAVRTSSCWHISFF